MINETNVAFLDIETATDDLTPEQLEHVAIRYGNLKDPEKLATKKKDTIGKLATCPFACKIIAIGWWAPQKQVIVWTKHPTEREMLDRLLERYDSHFRENQNETIITWRGPSFDWPVIRYRSSIHSLPFPYNTSRDNNLHFIVNGYNKDWEHYPIRFHALRHGIELSNTIPSRDVPIYYKQGKWAPIVKHLEEDLRITYELYRKYEKYIRKS